MQILESKKNIEIIEFLKGAEFFLAGMKAQ
jgi:hypothetical protein